jgi:hypothetical protein
VRFWFDGLRLCVSRSEWIGRAGGAADLQDVIIRVVTRAPISGRAGLCTQTEAE